jgi:chorismate mutase
MHESKAAITIQNFFRHHQLAKQQVLHQAISKSPSVLLLHMMNLRFQCMRAVAAAKFPIQRPIEDKEQEARVIAVVKKLATDSGITDLESIDRLFQHSIELSKTVQRPYYGLIWDKAPRETQTLVNNAYTGL